MDLPKRVVFSGGSVKGHEQKYMLRPQVAKGVGWGLLKGYILALLGHISWLVCRFCVSFGFVLVFVSS